MKKKRKVIVWVIILVVIVGVVLFVTLKPKNEELTFRTYEVENQTVGNSVTATGTIEPVESVDVGTQVSGEIKYIYVDYNSVVKKGELIAELDKKNLLEQLSQSESNLRSSQSQLEYAKTNFERTEKLYKANASTQVAYDESRNALVQAQTSLSKSQSAVDQAKTNLAYAEVYSPIDGVILSREVEVGQTVAASYSTPTLFKIARDLTQMQVEAAVDEADIGQVKVNQRVTFTVDAYVDDIFVGEVQQIRLQPTTTSSVVTYTVIISAPNPALKLFPGMTASVTIITEEEQGLAVPAEALKFTPTEKVMTTLRKQRQKENKAPAEHPRRMQQDNRDSEQTVWVKKNGMIEPRHIKTGMSDGVYKIVTDGLQVGDSVVLSANFVSKQQQQKQGTNLFMPGRPKRK